MMKLFVSLVLLSCCLAAIARSSGPDTSANNLYHVALAAYLEKRNEMYEGNADLRKRDYLNVFVEQDIFLTEGLPTSIGRNKVEYLDYEARIQTFKKLRGEFTLVVVRPMKNVGDKLVVSFGEYLWRHNKNSSNYALSGGALVYLKSDCENHRFVVDGVELGGV